MSAIDSLAVRLSATIFCNIHTSLEFSFVSSQNRSFRLSFISSVALSSSSQSAFILPSIVYSSLNSVILGFGGCLIFCTACVQAVFIALIVGCTARFPCSSIPCQNCVTGAADFFICCPASANCFLACGFMLSRIA